MTLPGPARSLLTASRMNAARGKSIPPQIAHQPPHRNLHGIQVIHTHLEEPQHRVLKSGTVPLARPLVLPRRIPIATYLHRLLEIRRFLAKRSDLRSV